jgi:hypothetical protein
MGDQNHPANEDKIQTGGRQANAAQPLNASENREGARRHAVETGEATRTFGGGSGNPQPRQGAGDPSPRSNNEGNLGPGGDPVEGRR